MYCVVCMRMRKCVCVKCECENTKQNTFYWRVNIILNISVDILICFYATVTPRKNETATNLA